MGDDRVYDMHLMAIGQQPLGVHTRPSAHVKGPAIQTKGDDDELPLGFERTRVDPVPLEGANPHESHSDNGAESPPAADYPSTSRLPSHAPRTLNHEREHPSNQDISALRPPDSVTLWLNTYPKGNRKEPYPFGNANV